MSEYQELPDMSFVSSLETSVGSTQPKHFNHVTGFDRRISIENHTDHDISVQYRDGVVFGLPPQLAAGCAPGIRIHVETEIGKGVEIKGYGTANAPKEAHEEVRAWKEAVAGLNENTLGSRCFSVDYFVSHEQLKLSGGIFYLTQLDLLISTRSDNVVGVHPYSQLAHRLRSVVDDGFLNMESGFGFNIRLVDNKGEQTDKYLNLNGEIFRITPEQCPFYRDGVHVVRSAHRLAQTRNAHRPESVCLPFEEGYKKYNLFDSREEALAYGDTAKVRERELEERAHEVKKEEADWKAQKNQRDQELEILKHNFETTRLEQQRKAKEEELQREQRKQYYQEELERLQHERERLLNELKIGQAASKDYYEHRSMQRKDSSELMKYIPTVISAIGGIATLFLVGRMK